MRGDPDMTNEGRNKLRLAVGGWGGGGAGIHIQNHVFTVVMFINLTPLQGELTQDYFYANMHLAKPRARRKEKKKTPKYIS